MMANNDDGFCCVNNEKSVKPSCQHDFLKYLVCGKETCMQAMRQAQPLGADVSHEAAATVATTT